MRIFVLTAVSVSVLTSGCTDTEVIGRYPKPTIVSEPVSAGGTVNDPTAEPEFPYPSVDAAADSSGEDPSSYRGPMLITEGFEDANLGERDWYDFAGLALSEEDKVNGAASFFCQFEVGRVDCVDGRPGRHLFEGQEQLFVSYWIKFSDDHDRSAEIYLLSNQDPPVIGPSFSVLTVGIGQRGGVPYVFTHDNPNVDPNCVLLNDAEVVGCDGGAFEDYVFTEQRSVNACNGHFGDATEYDCSEYPDVQSGYASYRAWYADEVAFAEETGQHYKGYWHLVEFYVRLNSIDDSGVGLDDGALRYWVDGELLITRDDLLFRTGAFPDLKLNQLLIAPWFNSGATVAQALWMDEIIVRAGN